MVSARGSTKTKRVLLGRSGSEKSFGQLADGLRSEGFDVVEEKSSPVGAHSTGDSIAKVLSGVDVVLLVVHRYDGADGPMAPFERVLHDANVIQESIGDRKVILLVEETVSGLPETGLTHIRFPTSRADMILQDVVNKIGVAAPISEPVRDLHARIPMSEQAMSSALRVPWLLVFVVLISAAIPLALALNSFRGSDDGGGDGAAAESETQTMRDVAAGLRRPESAIGGQPGFDATPAQPADGSGQSGNPGTDGLGSDDASAEVPAAPELTLGGDNDLLPAVCSVDLRKGSLLDDALTCNTVGQLMIEGLDGPWHNEIAAIAVADGVVGRLRYEIPPSGSTDGPEAIDLASGSAVLNQTDATFGVIDLTLRFSANNQHVHLFRNADGSGEFATLTFTLDQ